MTTYLTRLDRDSNAKLQYKRYITNVELSCPLGHWQQLNYSHFSKEGSSFFTHKCTACDWSAQLQLVGWTDSNL
jgi:hypothetical protein